MFSPDPSLYKSAAQQTSTNPALAKSAPRTGGIFKRLLGGNRNNVPSAGKPRPSLSTNDMFRRGNAAIQQRGKQMYNQEQSDMYNYYKSRYTAPGQLTNEQAYNDWRLSPRGQAEFQNRLRTPQPAAPQTPAATLAQPAARPAAPQTPAATLAQPAARPAAPQTPAATLAQPAARPAAPQAPAIAPANFQPSPIPSTGFTAPTLSHGPSAAVPTAPNVAPQTTPSVTAPRAPGTIARALHNSVGSQVTGGGKPWIPPVSIPSTNFAVPSLNQGAVNTPAPGTIARALNNSVGSQVTGGDKPWLSTPDAAVSPAVVSALNQSPASAPGELAGSLNDRVGSHVTGVNKPWATPAAMLSTDIATPELSHGPSVAVPSTPAAPTAIARILNGEITPPTPAAPAPQPAVEAATPPAPRKGWWDTSWYGQSNQPAPAAPAPQPAAAPAPAPRKGWWDTSWYGQSNQPAPAAPAPQPAEAPTPAPNAIARILNGEIEPPAPAGLREQLQADVASQQAPLNPSPLIPGSAVSDWYPARAGRGQLGQYPEGVSQARINEFERALEASNRLMGDYGIGGAKTSNPAPAVTPMQQSINEMLAQRR